MLYNIGDVVIISECFYGHEFEIGERVKIISVDSESEDYDAESINRVTDTWFIREDEIEGKV